MIKGPNLAQSVLAEEVHPTEPDRFFEISRAVNGRRRYPTALKV
jgi:hypothetical protein